MIASSCKVLDSPSAAGRDQSKQDCSAPGATNAANRGTAVRAGYCGRTGAGLHFSVYCP
jgi:hypothetical protein